jgi:hypothetical protein
MRSSVVAVLLVAFGVLLLSGPNAFAAKRCGHVKGPARTEIVGVLRGPTTCAHARKVFRDFYAGHGVRHQGRDHAHSYTSVDGWKCNTAPRGAGCLRGRSVVVAVDPAALPK